MSNTRDKVDYIKTLNDLKPGDILLYRSDGSATAKAIGVIGSLKKNTHGHYDTTHAAICVKPKFGSRKFPDIKKQPVDKLNFAQI
ncbi:MAG: hypothetical protein ABI091_24595 [Ferruginibacter sp.]